MKFFFTLYLLVLATAVPLRAQTLYINNKDVNHPGEFILTGIISKYILQNDSSFRWYAGSQVNYNPDKEFVNVMEAAKGKIQFIIFGGTWCEDTQNVLPKFFKWQEQSGFPDSGISFFGVDRAKKTPGNFSEAFNITNVPTIIVMKDGKELGRVVEYGKTGKWDAELAGLLIN